MISEAVIGGEVSEKTRKATMRLTCIAGTEGKRARIAAPEEFAAAETEKSELDRLRRENAQLRMDNEFLRKAAAFFASKQQNRNASS